MGLTRRGFVKTAAAGAIAVLAEDLHAQPPQLADCNQEFSVLVDTAVCIGCRQCELACRRTHFDPLEDSKPYEDKSVYKKHRRPSATAYTVVNEFGPERVARDHQTIKVQCMHCLNPACVSACIVGALEKQATGAVTYDAWKCIGCRYCMVACPFQIPSYEYDEPLDPQVRKCTFCYERVAVEGLVPACVEICPNEALTFGLRSDMLDLAHSRIRSHPDKYIDHVYGEKEVGGTSWLYLSTVDFTQTELPKLSDQKLPELTETIQHGIFKSFVPPIALYGLLGLVMHAFQDKEEGGSEK